MTSQNPIMERQADKLRRRAGMEDIARELGEKRAAHADDLAADEQSIRELLPQMVEAGVPLDTYAKLVGVSRQTLYRWQETARRIKK